MKKRSGFGWLEFAQGILLIGLGVYTFINPGGVLTGLAIVYGLIAAFTGVMDIVFYVRMERYTGFGPTISLVTGILGAMAGFMLLISPGTGRWAAAIFFPLWFIAHCVSRLCHLPVIRLVAGKVYFYLTLALNLLGIVLGVCLLADPAAAIASLGGLIGAYMILSGVESVLSAFSNIGKAG